MAPHHIIPAQELVVGPHRGTLPAFRVDVPSAEVRRQPDSGTDAQGKRARARMQRCLPRVKLVIKAGASRVKAADVIDPPSANGRADHLIVLS